MSEEEKDRLDNLNKLVNRVQNSLDEGNMAVAKGALTRGWRDAVPDLPRRFTVVLVRVNIQDLKALIKRNKRNKTSSPQLKIVKKKKSYFVETSRGERLVLGEMPYDEIRLLEEMGKESKLFRPKLFEIYYNDEGKVRGVAIEMVRPDSDKPATRGKRKPEETFEHTSVQLNEAIDNIILETDEEVDI
jgi:hypothetical protein